MFKYKSGNPHDSCEGAEGAEPIASDRLGALKRLKAYIRPYGMRQLSIVQTTYAAQVPWCSADFHACFDASIRQARTTRRHTWATGHTLYQTREVASPVTRLEYLAALQPRGQGRAGWYLLTASR
jgi:hypothetical protein